MAGISKMPKPEETTGKASDAAAGAAQKAQGTAANLGQKVQEVASNVAHKAQDVASTVAHKADDAISTVGSGMSSLAGTIREKGPQAGVLGSATSTVAGGLQSTGDYLQSHGMGDMLNDVSGVIRRYPLQSLLMGFGIGFLMARVTSRG
jgi:hypothetical protein